jgi:flagellar protein FlaJ
MSFSRFFQKRGGKTSFKVVRPFELYYQLTYMSAMAASNLSRSRLFIQSARTHTDAAVYFAAVQRLVEEFRLDYPEACRRIGLETKSENMRSFLLRLSDALRSGEPIDEFLTRESEAQGLDYQNQYERDLEALKQWTNAFSSIMISVSLIVIIQVISAMIYSTNVRTLSGLVATGIFMSAFAAWIIYRSAPQEIMVGNPRFGTAGQQRAQRLFRTMGPCALMLGAVLYMVHIPTGWTLVISAMLLIPVGWYSLASDREIAKKDSEFSTFLRSTGAMATSSGATLKQSLKRIDLTSFPYLEQDIRRLQRRLDALVEPEICWKQFGTESGSRLISEVTDIFYHSIKLGGDPERAGYLCSLFTAKTTQLRAKRRMVAGTFSGLATVMQAVVAGLMVFVLSIVNEFAALVATLMPESTDGTAPTMSLGMAEFTAGELNFLALMTVTMIVMLGIVSATAIVLADGGYRLKVTLYMVSTMFISGIALLVVPPLVSNILTI